jgi:hypothetical protein
VPASLPDTSDNRLAGYRALTWDVKTQGGFVTCLCVGQRGEIWVGCEDTAVFRYSPLAPDGHRWTHFTAKDGLGDSAYAMTIDRVGRLWVGSLNGGVSVYNGREWRNYDFITGPIGSRVFSMATSPTDGSVWLGTCAGLTRFLPCKDSWTDYTRADGLPSDQISAVTVTPSGTVIAGSDCDGLAIATAADNYSRWRVVAPPAGQSPPPAPGGAGLPSSQINALLVASQTSTIYAGTSFGLARSEDGGSTFRFLRGAEWKRRAAGIPGGLPPVNTDTHAHHLLEDYVQCLAEDPQGRLVIGYRQAGWETVDPRDGRRVSNSRNEDVTAIVSLPDGLTFLGTYGHGLVAARTPSDTMSPGSDGTVSQKPAPQPAEFPAPRRPMAAAELHALSLRPSPVPHEDGDGAYYCDDWCTEGRWMRGYGSRYGLLLAAGAPLNHVIASDLAYRIRVRSGSNVSHADSLRYWIHWLRAPDNPNVLFDPVVGYPREAEVDDHGEMYSMVDHDGPGLIVEVQVPPGVHRLSVYFYNKDGHEDNNRFRDYLLELKEANPAMTDPDKLPTLARARVHAFWGGVWKQFILKGPDTGRGSKTFLLMVRRNGSFNTILPGVFIDKLAGPPGAYEHRRSPWLAALHYAAPDPDRPVLFEKPMEPDKSAMVSSARELWDASQGAVLSGAWLARQKCLRLDAYRSAHSVDGPQLLLENWRWFLHLWTSADVQDFNDAVQDARKVLLSHHASLAGLHN